eukprot:7641695-Alexandrium_andersonii.AAC.1
MSASLVGSEMCIRDSESPFVDRFPEEALVRHLAILADQVLTGHIPGAVSYTHLTLPTICSV